MFKKQAKRYWTWESPDGYTKNMIDFVLCNAREIIADCGGVTRADMGSDHRMIKTKIILNKKLARERKMKRIKPLNVEFQYFVYC